MTQVALRSPVENIAPGEGGFRNRLFDLSVGLVEDLSSRGAMNGGTTGFSPDFQIALRQTHLAFPPVAFLRRLAALVPPPRANLVRYFGAHLIPRWHFKSFGPPQRRWCVSGAARNGSGQRPPIAPNGGGGMTTG
jgi:hypothetical protein